MSAGRPQSGLTLLEVIAATAIVLVTVAAVTTATVTAARAGGRAQDSAAADAVLLAEAARLRALPFFVPLPPDWPTRRVAAAPSAVGELFPHADPALNADDARFLATGAQAGAFETRVAANGHEIRRIAWMASCDASGWRCAPVMALEGWRGWGAAAMPAEALLVRLEVSSKIGSQAGWSEDVRSLTFVLTADGRPRSVDPTSLAGEWAP